jgi:membrane-bound ClpP family serine protease
MRALPNFPSETAMEITDAVPAPDTPTDPLNMRVAVTVALLATFMGICKVKDDNINQAMQQAQANKVDHWSFYQARNVREEVARSTVAQLRLAALGRPAAEQEAYAGAVKEFLQIADDQKRKKEEVKTQAEQDQADYDAANFRDDQFDLSDALLAIAISLLAITALTRQRWLFIGALVPTALGVFFGLAGLLGLPFHPTALMALLS